MKLSALFISLALGGYSGFVLAAPVSGTHGQDFKRSVTERIPSGQDIEVALRKREPSGQDIELALRKETAFSQNIEDILA
ncbi:hypothetical protein GQ53DRAFT_826707 [Thozetella sp. PMI_491]|nr:hypothetical protein GQ53DRAFT_826707 [Thozetella sp. PMI_491]